LKEVKDWTIEDAKQQASKEDINFEIDHLVVVTYLREFYVKHGWPKSTHELTQVLDQHFEEKGGNKYLHRLFPNGPIAQATRLAGVPTPAYATDKSFGSTY